MQGVYAFMVLRGRLEKVHQILFITAVVVVLAVVVVVVVVV